MRKVEIFFCGFPEVFHTKTATKCIFQVLEANPTWWKVKCGAVEGYASKYFFAKRDAATEKEKEPWYFGDICREDAERFLKDPANPDGSFLVRHTSSEGGMDVLVIKHFGVNERYEYFHHPIKTDRHTVWLASQSQRYKDLSEMIEELKLEKERQKTKLTSISRIPNPHTDTNFEFYNKDHNSVCIPYDQIDMMRTKKGQVKRARLKDFTEIAVKKLTVERKDEDTEEVSKYFDEIANLKKVDHPNLVELFGYTMNDKGDTFLLLEFMAMGNLKNHLKFLRETNVDNLGKRLLLWAFQVARGMQRLESLQIVHGHLFAR